MANSIFITAAEARQNPIRERVVFDEGTAVSGSILEAVRTGYYNALVNGDSPMTQTVAISTPVYSIDDTANTFEVAGHGYNTGDEVFVYSSGQLPSPLTTDTVYYIIYVDIDTVKLAATKQDALAKRPISIDLVSGVNSITLTNQGTGYTYTPTVVLTGGNATVQATAQALLAPYGDISYISVGYQGVGYHYVPTVTVVAQGAGATAGAVTFQAISAVVAASGVNYRVNDLLTVVGGTGTATTALVTSVGSGGAVVTVRLYGYGNYSALPTLSGVATTVSPGGGTGCTLTLGMGIASIAVANTGGQYTAPPIVTIIGGGGTGATATTVLSGGVVSSIPVTSTGSNYTFAPTITMSSGSGATAVPYLVPTGIGNVTLLNNGGATYISPPGVGITSAGSGATVSDVYMAILSAILATGGAGSQYSKGDVLIIAGGTGSDSATIMVDEVGLQGQIVLYTLQTSGSYSTLPVMNYNAVYGGTGQAASFNLTSSIGNIIVSSGGTGYTAPPTVLITANDLTGYGASAYATMSADSVSSIVITAPGTNYSAIPTVTITSGSNAAISATLSATSVQYVNVSNAGSGYTTATVIFVTDHGVNATAVPVIVGGEIVSIDVTFEGSGYILAPTVIIDGDGQDAAAYAELRPTTVDYLSITNFGENYTSIPAVSIGGAATANVSLYSTSVSQIVVTNGGDKYTSTPQVNVIPGAGETATPIQPTTTVTRGFSIDSIVITSSGDGYTSAPTVAISAPHNLIGNAATATATIGYGTGTMTIQPYASSRDYWLIWQNQTPSDTNLTRPYAERMDTVIAYFTNLGYTINRQTNPATGNTLQWNVKW